MVKQIGYMHNAIGHVFKDLAKILSYKFPEINATNNHQYRKEIVINKNDYPVPGNWQELYSRQAKVQTYFFEAMYAIVSKEVS